MLKTITNILAAAILATHAIGIALLMPSFAAADDGSTCYTIVSSDHRAYCLAKARKEPSMCYAIIDTGMRSACLAEVRN